MVKIRNKQQNHKTQHTLSCFMICPLDYLFQLIAFIFYIHVKRNPTESLFPFLLAGKCFFKVSFKCVLC